jgi:hypothetical protein
MPGVSRPRLAGLFDHLALLAFLAFIAIHFTGGFTVEIGVVTFSARGQQRALFVALAALALRLLLDRTTPPPAGWRRLRDRIYDPLADEPRSSWAVWKWPDHALALAGFCGFGLMLLWAQISRLDAIPDIGDSLFSVWRVSWVYRQLLGDPRNLFDANIFHPLPLTLTYSDSMLLPSLTTAPLLATGLHPVVATNIILVLSFVASAFTGYLLVGRLTGSPWSAFISGLIFGFYPYRFEHYHHFELLMTYCLPLVLLAVHCFFSTLKIRYAVFAALFAVAQLYSSMYLAVLFMWQVLGMSLLIISLERLRFRRLVVPGLIAATLAFALAWPLVRMYSSGQLDERPTKELGYYSAEAGDYLQAHPRSAVWGAGSRPFGERALFPGVVAIALALVGLTRPLGRVRVVYLGALLIAFEISLGVNGHIYPYLYEWFGFMRGMRAPARAGFLFGLALAVLAGFGVQRLVAGRSRAVAFAIGAVLTIATGVDLRPTLDLQTAWQSPPGIYQSIRSTDVLAEFPMGSLTPDTPLLMDTPYMYFSIWHGAQLINGYSGHLPPDHFNFLITMEAFPDPSTIELLRQRGTTHVTINCFFYRGCRGLVARANRAPDLRPVSSTLWEGREVQLYELRRDR